MADDSLTPEQERAIRELFEQASLNDYPNPERIGCPGDNFLKQLVRDRNSIKLADERLKHVVHCSPCFREFVAFRDQPQRKTPTRRTIFTGAGAIAAAVAIGIAVQRRPHPGPATNTGAHVIDIDLRQFAGTRGVDSAPAPTPPQIDLPRTRLDLRIILPFASPEGQYEVQILRADDSATGLKAAGIAHIDNGITRLEVKLDLSGLPPSRYQLGVRRIPFDWLPVPVDVR
jgi:hypothetical protein